MANHPSTCDTGRVGRWVSVAALLATSLMASCGAGPDGRRAPTAEDGVRIASFDFAESEIVAELYAQVLEAAGFQVIRIGAIGPREVVAPALEQGVVDLVPEYLGTASSYFGAVAVEIDSLASSLEPRGLVPLAPALAQDVNVLVVTRLSAADLGLATISDLATVADGLTIGGPVECPDRPLCLMGLRDVYGLEFATFVPQRSMAVTAEALRRYEIDVGVMFSTAPEVAEGRLIVLEDDRHLQPAENVVPVVRAATIEQWGAGLVVALDGLSSRLTTEDLRTLNREVRDGAPVESAVADWLRSAGAG